MELQEIDDRLKNLAKDIKELEGKKNGYLFMENLLLEQEKLIEKVQEGKWREKRLVKNLVATVRQDSSFSQKVLPQDYFEIFWRL